MDKILYRTATAGDCAEILRLIKELADFEHGLDQVTITEEKLRADGFGPEKFYHCIVAEEKSSSESDDHSCSLVEYAIYVLSYSSWSGPTIYLEDLYVTTRCRRLGIGKRLLRLVAKDAIVKGCQRMLLCVLNWNTTAIDFYNRLGGIDMTKNDGILLYRFEEDKIKALTAL